MLKILWKRGEIAPEEQFLLLSTIFCYLMLDFYVKTRIRFSFRDKRLFEITEVEITRVDCMSENLKKVYATDDTNNTGNVKTMYHFLFLANETMIIFKSSSMIYIKAKKERQCCLWILRSLWQISQWVLSSQWILSSL